MTAARPLRVDLQQIADWVRPESRVLDLGCGDGALLAHLREHKRCRGYGVEISDDHVAECVRSGINVIQANLDAGLRMFADAMFDTVVLSQTLQAMHNAEGILREMARVARQGVVSFPNFGHWKHVVSLLAGRMPVTRHILNCDRVVAAVFERDDANRRFQSMRARLDPAQMRECDRDADGPVPAHAEITDVIEKDNGRRAR